jgi:small multidrug resistance family-3 protein
VKTITLYLIAAVAEIGGCYAFWMWLKLNRSPFWAAAGLGALIVFAWLLTRVDLAFAGRAYAAYGGIYIATTLAWLWLVEGARPDRWDFAGVTICLIGAGVIVFAPRATS